MKSTTLKLSLFVITLLFFGLSVNAQRKLKGTVYKDGKPAAGATIVVHKVSNSFFTSFDGKYEMDIHAKSKFVKITLGEETQKLDISGEVMDVYFGQKPSGDDEDGPAETEAGVDCRTQRELQGVPEYQKLYVYGDDYRLKQYAKAYPKWSALLQKFPCSSRNIYSQGAVILAHMINNAKDETQRNKYVDTLMLMYDKRIKHFGKSKKYPKGYILGRKGKDLLQYRKEDVAKAYEMLKKSIGLQGENSESAILLTYFQASKGALRAEKIDGAAVLEDYLKVSGLLEKQIKNSTGEEQEAAKTALGGVEYLFSRTPVATCEDLERIFTPKFEASKDDVEMLKKITSILDSKDCTESELFANAAVKLYEKEPSAKAAYMIALTYLKQKNLDESAKFFLEAIKGEENDSLKSRYYHKLGLVTLAQNNPAKSYSYALEASKLTPKWGTPYILMGIAYAAGKDACGKDNFEKTAVYWFAVDKFIKAKSVDADVADEANKYISQYRPHFPNKEEIFMRGLTNKTYSSMDKGCWIKEKTKARPPK